MTTNASSQGGYPPSAPVPASLSFGAKFLLADFSKSFYSGAAFGIVQAGVILPDDPKGVYIMPLGCVISGLAYYVQGFSLAGDKTTFQIIIDGGVAKTVQVTSEFGDQYGFTTNFAPVVVRPGQRVCMVWNHDDLSEVVPGNCAVWLS